LADRRPGGGRGPRRIPGGVPRARRRQHWVGQPVDENTVFRIASITKTFTAIAVLQFWERGLVDLDAPANDYLRAYRWCPPTRPSGRQTLRHLLTHTAGVRAVRRPTDLLRPALGWGAPVGRPPPRPLRAGSHHEAVALGHDASGSHSASLAGPLPGRRSAGGSSFGSTCLMTGSLEQRLRPRCSSAAGSGTRRILAVAGGRRRAAGRRGRPPLLPRPTIRLRPRRQRTLPTRREHAGFVRP
jgi:Beta-lactamase